MFSRVTFIVQYGREAFQLGKVIIHFSPFIQFLDMKIFHYLNSIAPY